MLVQTYSYLAQNAAGRSYYYHSVALFHSSTALWQLQQLCLLGVCCMFYVSCLYRSFKMVAGGDDHRTGIAAGASGRRRVHTCLACYLNNNSSRFGGSITAAVAAKKRCNWDDSSRLCSTAHHAALQSMQHRRAAFSYSAQRVY